MRHISCKWDNLEVQPASRKISFRKMEMQIIHNCNQQANCLGSKQWSQRWSRDWAMSEKIMYDHNDVYEHWAVLSCLQMYIRAANVHPHQLHGFICSAGIGQLDVSLKRQYYVSENLERKLSVMSSDATCSGGSAMPQYSLHILLKAKNLPLRKFWHTSWTWFRNVFTNAAVRNWWPRREKSHKCLSSMFIIFVATTLGLGTLWGTLLRSLQNTHLLRLCTLRFICEVGAIQIQALKFCANHWVGQNWGESQANAIWQIHQKIICFQFKQVALYKCPLQIVNDLYSE